MFAHFSNIFCTFVEQCSHIFLTMFAKKLIISAMGLGGCKIMTGPIFFFLLYIFEWLRKIQLVKFAKTFITGDRIYKRSYANLTKIL